MSRREAAIAVNRFGLGPRPGELEAAGANPRRWLLEQIEADYAAPRQFAGFPGTSEQRKNYIYRYNELGPRLNRGQREAKERGDAAAVEKYGADIKNMLEGYVGWVSELFQLEFAARTNVALTTPEPFRERLVRFWSNHLVVPAIKQPTMVLTGAYEREVIRPYTTGKFADMLMACVKNPAMLVFLDNYISVGPNSPMGLQKKIGLNENLAREILELHTLGVEGGYGQEDVIALAKGITGWSTSPISVSGLVESRQPDGPLSFAFFQNWHEPGAFTVLGKSYAAGGLAQGEAMLNDLARHPNTARFLATKLARHFVSDDPPPALVKRLADSYLAHDTDLAEMARALVESEEPWQKAQSKLKQPEEYVVSALRTLGATLLGDAVPSPKLYHFETYRYRDTMWPGTARPASGMGDGMMADEGDTLGGLISDQMRAARPGAVAAARSVGTVYRAIEGMGQRPWNAPGPQGWYDSLRDWSGADSLLKRVEWSLEAATAHADKVPDARAFLADTLGDLASDGLKTAVSRAATSEQALGIILASPDFQRR